jgi:hypothetical protein
MECSLWNFRMYVCCLTCSHLKSERNLLAIMNGRTSERLACGDEVNKLENFKGFLGIKMHNWTTLATSLANKWLSYDQSVARRVWIRQKFLKRTLALFQIFLGSPDTPGYTPAYRNANFWLPWVKEMWYLPCGYRITLVRVSYVNLFTWVAAIRPPWPQSVARDRII